MTRILLPAAALTLLIVVFNGCVGAASYEAANCDRFRFPSKGINILACDDDAVGKHCKRLTGVSYHPRACHIPGKFGRRATIAIGKSYMKCLPHEIAHNEYPDDFDKVHREYPCVGDRRTK